jgi:hypothetical protein
MSQYTSRLDELKARLAAASGCNCGDPACPYNTADLRWAVEEIDYLRFYLSVLGDFAYTTDALRSALEESTPARLTRRRRAYEEALQELLATPNWRPGECHEGCRRYATHVLVFEQDGCTQREPCCEECGRSWLTARRTAIEAAGQPAVAPRLERIPQPSAEAREAVQ